MQKTAHWIISIVIAFGAILIWQFSSSTPVIQKQDDKVEPVANAAPSPAPATEAPNVPITKPANNTKIMQATLHTTKGDITIEFDGANTPNTVANFIKLAKASFYDGVKFHRVIKGFMIQGGDPFSKDDSQMDRWGTGSPGYSFADEITPTNHNAKGTIAMANSGPNTNGSQFFINAKDNSFLDTKHTVFGKVISGLDVVSAIENTPIDDNDRPVEAVVIKSIDLK